MPVLTRSARPEDAAALAAAYDWLFAAPGVTPADWDPVRAQADLRRLMAAEDVAVMVAEDGGEIVGFCTAYDDISSVRFGRRVWVEDLAVDPSQRSRGVGRRLLDGAKAWARERGASHLELDSAPAREDAHRFYDREGAVTRSFCFGFEV
jgi:GNAT superfamily N-acetyltransferase